jgi:hypothetical protein
VIARQPWRKIGQETERGILGLEQAEGQEEQFPHVEKSLKCISYLRVKPHKTLYQSGINHFIKIAHLFEVL